MTRTDVDARLAQLTSSMWAVLQRLAFVAALTLLAPLLVSIPVSAATVDPSASPAGLALAPSGVPAAPVRSIPDPQGDGDVPVAAEPEARSAATARFVPSGVGTVARSADVLPAPAGGSPIAVLSAGTSVTIGGKVQVPAGFLPRYAYWVRADAPSGTVYGFMPERAVIVTAGVVPRLDLTGLPAEGLLAPSAAAGSDGAGAIAGTGAAASVAVGAGAGAGLGDAGAASGAASAGVSLAGSSASSTSSPSPSSSSSSSALVALAESGAGRSWTAAPVVEAGTVAWLPDTVSRWMPLIRTAAARHGVDPHLVAIVVLVESGGHPGAVSPSGATGLMQVMPGTARDIAARRGLDPRSAERMSDPETNLDFGAWYLADMLRAFGVSDDPDWQRTVETAAAAYNGGPGHVGQHLTTGQPLALETASYRAWIGGMWRERALGQSATLSAWLDAGGQRLVDAARAVTVAYS